MIKILFLFLLLLSVKTFSNELKVDLNFDICEKKKTVFEEEYNQIEKLKVQFEENFKNIIPVPKVIKKNLKLKLNLKKREIKLVYTYKFN